MRKIAQAGRQGTVQRGLPSLVLHPVRLASMAPVASRRTRILTGQTGFDKPEQPWAWSKDCRLLLAGHPHVPRRSAGGGTQRAAHRVRTEWCC